MQNKSAYKVSSIKRYVFVFQMWKDQNILGVLLPEPQLGLSHKLVEELTTPGELHVYLALLKTHSLFKTRH